MYVCLYLCVCVKLYLRVSLSGCPCLFVWGYLDLCVMLSESPHQFVKLFVRVSVSVFCLVTCL